LNLPFELVIENKNKNWIYYVAIFSEVSYQIDRFPLWQKSWYGVLLRDYLISVVI